MGAGGVRPLAGAWGTLGIGAGAPEELDLRCGLGYLLACASPEPRAAAHGAHEGPCRLHPEAHRALMTAND